MGELLSIVIPIYNAADSINLCLDSIISSTGQFEIVLVNDGSTDSSLTVCKGYAKNDSRIRVISQKNAGVSAARNTGLKYASGEYIAFADADDTVLPGYIPRILAALEEEPELLLFSHFRQLESGSMVEKKLPLNEGYSTDLKKLFELALTWKTNQVWDKVFKRDIIERSCLQFSVGVKTSEDLQFWATYARNIKSYIVLPDTLYYYMFSAGGAARNYRIEYISDLCNVLSFGNALINDYSLEELKSIFYKTLMWQLLPVIKGLLNKGCDPKEISVALKDTRLVTGLMEGDCVSTLHGIYRFLLSHGSIRSAASFYAFIEKVKGNG